MQKVQLLLLLVIMPVLLFSGEPDGCYTQSDLREFRTPSSGADPSYAPIHPSVNSIRYAFYPPRKESRLFIAPGSEAAMELRLVYSGSAAEQSLRLPASAEGGLFEVLLNGASELEALCLPPGARFYFNPPSGDPVGRVSSDRPEELVVFLPATPPAGGEDAPVDLVLTMVNPEPVMIKGPSEYSAALRAHSRTRRFHFPSPRGEEWMISPLSGLESFSSAIKVRPEFPVPLEREGMQILNADPARWRNRDFELYRWSSLPEVLIFDCRNYEVQNRFFRRLAFFVEKKGFRGRILSNQELKGKHGWNANDYRASDLAAFFNRCEDLGTDLYEEELFLRDLLVREGILIREGETFTEGRGAVNSMALESGPGLRYRFFTHEASHGIYFTQKKYRDFVRQFWESLAEDDRELWRLYLAWNAYDPEDEDLMMNEFQAYFTQQPVSDASDYLMPRMIRIAAGYPSFKALLEQKKDGAPGLFRSWAEGLEAFQRENWGLEAGNFSPLQAEWPLKNE